MKKITIIEPAEARAITAKTRVAAYCRVSTGMDDQLVSLETQKGHYENLIGSNPEWEYAGLYYDEGISGTSKEKRPALMRMVADCEAGKIDRIMTKSLSRFARNTTDCLELVRKLLDLGITIYFEKENLDTGSMESELLLSIMSSLAESESVSISENSKWSVRHRYENGTFKIGYAPFGYSSQDGEMVINEDEAKWVRWIFEQTLSGKASAAIARELNEKQVPSRRGGKWTPTTIRGILTNEKYTGDCLFQKTYSDFRFKRHVNRGERDQFYMEDHHEALVSREEFEPFTGKLVCGECGSGFKRHINSTGSIRYPVWVCKQHLDDVSTCSLKYIREVDLEYAFTTMMNKLIFGRQEVLHTLIEAIRGETHKGNLLRIDEIDQKLEKIVERRQTLTTIMTRAAEADALTAEKEQLVKEVTGCMKMTEALNDLIRYVGHAQPSPDFDGELVERFLDHGEVLSREEVTFHLKCGLSLTERMGEA